MTSSRKAKTHVKERRMFPRVHDLKHLDIQAVVRWSHNQVSMAKVMNLSLQGTLLEFPATHIRSTRVDDLVSIKIHLCDDIVWLPGVVRHCNGSRIGVCFQDYGKGLGARPRSILARVLRDVLQYQ